MDTAPALNVCAGCAARSAPVVTSETVVKSYNTDFTYQIQATNSPTEYYATGLPMGVTLDQSTGIISGTIDLLESITLNVSARNMRGTGTAIVTLVIACQTGGPYGTLTNATGVWSGAGSDVLKVGPGTQYPVGLSLSDAKAWYNANWKTDFDLNWSYNYIPGVGHGTNPLVFAPKNFFLLDINAGSCPQDIEGSDFTGDFNEFYVTIFLSGDADYPTALAFGGLVYPRIQVMFNNNVSGGNPMGFIFNSVTIPEIAGSGAFVPNPVGFAVTVTMQGNIIPVGLLMLDSNYTGLTAVGTINIYQI